jgi:S-adenosylmethionine:tRNA ribosyltransferase-isomerase
MSECLSDYDYELPEELIASRPHPLRDGARMMVVERGSGRVMHSAVRDFPDFLQPGDLTVLNDSKVMRARLLAEGGKVEVFLLEKLEPRVWRCLVRPGKRFRLGSSVELASTRLCVRAVEDLGTRVVEFEEEPDLEREGLVPIPPYFERDADAEDIVRYQTVFAREEGSVAAPTAGLHFTPELLAQFPHAFVTLHVGIGTFQPVKTERLDEHRMHEEKFHISESAAEALNAANRLVAIGTTVTRVLESQPPGPILAGPGSTSIFLRPPCTFQRVGALLTNFHLPRSTLLMLVSAFAGRELMREAYQEAVAQRYRFFSYGDCMLIL